MQRFSAAAKTTAVAPMRPITRPGPASDGASYSATAVGISVELILDAFENSARVGALDGASVPK